MIDLHADHVEELVEDTSDSGQLFEVHYLGGGPEKWDLSNQEH